MTLEEIAARLDTIAVDLANALMPSADDPDRAEKAYALGIASHAVKQRAQVIRRGSLVSWGDTREKAE